MPLEVLQLSLKHLETQITHLHLGHTTATMNTAAFPPKQPAILRTMTARVGAILLNGMLAAFNFRRIKWHLILMKTGI